MWTAQWAAIMEKRMAFDFKKEYREFYLPKNKPEIVTVPKMNYIAVREKEIQMKQAALISGQLEYYMR